MPESLVVSFIERELRNPPFVVLSRSKSKEIMETGKFVIHAACCAQLDGNRQTVTLHHCDANDPLFQPLPTPARHGKKGTTSAAEIVNALGIEGEMLSTFRGKEIGLGIGKFAIRISLALEGHGLWIPTEIYTSIVTGGAIPRGAKSSTFKIPDTYWEGCPSVQGQISIQAAFVCPMWTFIFVDHNVMLTIHVMGLKARCTREDLSPGSQLWDSMWSTTHGPSLIHERSLAEDGLELWRQSKVRRQDDTPIFLAVKGNQQVFNGYGAQETCDMLFEALLSPCMPTYTICSNQVLWDRFKTAVFDYQDIRLAIVSETPSILPYVSSSRPFRFNSYGHERFLRYVSTYRRQYVQVDADKLEAMNSLNLLNPQAIIQDDGTGKDVDFHSPNSISVRPGCKSINLPIYQIKIPAGRTSVRTVNVYTPFKARPNPSWRPVISVDLCDKDIKDDCNTTTLGPYSFQVFVLAGWTSNKVKGNSKAEFGINKKVLQGRRAEQDVGNGRRKRPRVAEIKTSRDNRETKKTKKENAPVPSEPRTLRNGKKLVL